MSLHRRFGGVLLAWLLPAAHAQTLVGDLREEAAAACPPLDERWVLRQALRVAAHHHAECYRARADALAVVALFAVAVALLLALPLAGASLRAEAALLGVTGQQVVDLAWRRPDWLAAFAAGLCVGCAPGIAAHLRPARWHVALLATACALVAHGLMAAGMLAVAAWVGAQASPTVEDGPEAHIGSPG